MQKQLRQRFVTAAIGAVASLGISGRCRAQAQSPAAAPRPNIVFLLADDLGYGDPGCYGQTKIKTPNIDELAKEGVKFTQAYAAPVCAPARCTLMTGLNMGHCLIRGNAKVSLGPKDLTVAEVLKSVGYDTAAFGKWGIGEPGSTGTPTKKGFDTFYGFIDQTAAHNSYPTFLYQDETVVHLRNVVPNEGQYGQGVASVKVDFAPDLCQAETLKWLNNEPADHPFFLYVPFTPPHANDESHTNEVPNLGEYANTNWSEGDKQYAALVTWLDGYVGQIEQVLHARHLDQNTLVIFTSDNGPQAEGGNHPDFFDSAGPFRGIKRDLYEGGIREPMIAVWPGHIQPGTTTDQIFTFYDFLPTCAELAGAPIPANIDGISIAPTLMGQPQTQQHEFLYWEFHERGFDQAVRNGDWKAVRHGIDQPLELYNLKTDPAEAHDVAAQNPDEVKKILDYLATCRTDSPYFPITPARGRTATRAAN
jgi:arylsulfatase A-like enzyme